MQAAALAGRARTGRIDSPPTLDLAPRHLHQASDHDLPHERSDSPLGEAVDSEAAAFEDVVWLSQHAAGDVVPCVLAVTGRGNAHFVVLEHASGRGENVWIGVPVCLKASRVRRSWEALAPHRWDATPMCRACLNHIHKCRKCSVNVRRRIQWPDSP